MTATRVLRALTIALFCVPLFIGLGKADLQGDEAIYSYSVDEMLVNGDWMTPRSIPQQTPFLEKPPLKFWLIAAGIRARLLPDNEFGHRFWDALFGAVAFLYVFAIGRLLAGPVAGFVAVLMLFVQDPLLFDHGLRSNNMEAALFVGYSGGMYHALAWSTATTARARRLHPLAIGGWFATAFMCKFVAAVFLPMVLVVTAALFPRWRRRAIEDWRSWGGATLLALAIIAPWFAYQTVVHGEWFWHVILGEHVFQRMTVSVDTGHIRPWDFYFVRTAKEMARNGSIALIVIGLAILAWQTVRKRWDAGALVLLWFALPLVLISAGRSKLYHYVYPFLPPLALAAGYAAVVLFESGSRAWRWFEDATAGLELAFLRRKAWLRHVIIGVGIVAFAVAAWTVLHGRFGIYVGDTLLFRNRSIARPLVVSVVLLMIAGRSRLAARLALSLIVLAPLPGYVYAMSRLGDNRSILQELRACLREQQRPGETPRFLMHGDPGQWRYVYYFRHFGWQEPLPPEPHRLTDHLLTPGREAPVIIHAREVTPVPALARIPSVRFDDDRLLLLPGRFGVCAGR